MLAVNYSTVRNNFKGFCDKVIHENETVIITRKNEENVVLLSLDTWNHMNKKINQIEYLEKVNDSFEQVRQDKIVTKTLQELEAMTNNA